MSEHEGKFVVVDHEGWTSYAVSLETAKVLAAEYDDRCPADAPHTIYALGPAVPR